MSYPLNRYKKGTYKRSCDSCGFDYLRSQLIKQYDGMIVCKKCWHPKPYQEQGHRTPVRKPPALDVFDAN